MTPHVASKVTFFSNQVCTFTIKDGSGLLLKLENPREEMQHSFESRKESRGTISVVNVKCQASKQVSLSEQYSQVP